VSFLAPWALWAAGAVSAAVIALHILASKNPRVTALPTTKFVPDVPLRATARALRLSDVALMVLRVAVVMLVGVAFARTELTRGKRAVGRVVMVDRSSYDRDYTRAGDSAKPYFSRGDVLISFDSAAYRERGEDPEIALAGERFSRLPAGSLSAALAAGMRAASELRGDADSVELVLVSPFAASEWDAATAAIRASWPGRVRLVRIPGLDSVAEPVSIDVRGAAIDDPVRAAVLMLPRADTLNKRTHFVRVDRGAPSQADTAWTKFGAALVRWPASLDSSGWRARTRVDSTGAVIAIDGGDNAVVVSTFARAVDAPHGRTIARWSDGTPAANERANELGCIRDVAIPLARSGDLALRESTRRLVRALTAPCGGNSTFAPASDSALAQLRGTGPLVATRALASRTAPSGKLTTWLLVAALVLLLLEPLLRRQRASA
jgi:hypothetical protein